MTVRAVASVFDRRLPRRQARSGRANGSRAGHPHEQPEHDEVDMTIVPMVQSHSRMTVGQYGPPIMYVQFGILSGTGVSTSNVFGYMLTFDWKVWALLLSAMPVLALLISLSETIVHKTSWKEVPHRVHEWGWELFRNLLYENAAEKDAKRRERGSEHWLADAIYVNVPRIMWMCESGLVRKWMADSLGDWQRCVRQTGGHAAEDLTVSDTLASFVLWALVMAVALAVFLVEVLRPRSASSQRTLQTQRLTGRTKATRVRLKRPCMPRLKQSLPVC
ncbi:hypothetical protein HPB51_017075 [Rhipicephalus microplus]|uniref:Uncharacterized protein n=1 Tax=Rhipicephalus microplus TaxID=6941 RepID=A0A9J6F489_RHIMP|nr:hypothetical protein HPB51_017075 [Rhipicephalus microplus]